MRIGRIVRGRTQRLRIAGALVLGLLVATAVNALVATNTVPSTAAGSGVGTISGYTVTAVKYNLNTTNPANIDSVQFTLSAAATTVRVKLESSGDYYPAANCSASGNNWTCTTISPSQATVAGANELSVVSVA